MVESDIKKYANVEIGGMNVGYFMTLIREKINQRRIHRLKDISD